MKSAKSVYMYLVFPLCSLAVSMTPALANDDWNPLPTDLPAGETALVQIAQPREPQVAAPKEFVVTQPEKGRIAEPQKAKTVAPKEVRIGTASYYGPGFHGRRTASGERFNMNALTAAHRHYPFGTLLRVTNLRNQRATMVRVNDRGPFHKRRLLDLSRGAAREIGLTGSGTGSVKIEVMDWGWRGRKGY